MNVETIEFHRGSVGVERTNEGVLKRKTAMTIEKKQININ